MMPTVLAEILCKQLNGEDNAPEICISKFGLGATKLTVPELLSVYNAHCE